MDKQKALKTSDASVKALEDLERRSESIGPTGFQHVKSCCSEAWTSGMDQLRADIERAQTNPLTCERIQRPNFN